jgi:hypothetical protein
LRFLRPFFPLTVLFLRWYRTRQPYTVQKKDSLSLLLSRCDTCKLEGYCSSMCAAAHMFDHDCYKAPKPWLSPPTGPKQAPPTELGEEGLFGFIPWNWVRYGMLILASWLLYHGIEKFLDYRCGSRACMRVAHVVQPWIRSFMH